MIRVLFAFSSPIAAPPTPFVDDLQGIVRVHESRFDVHHCPARIDLYGLQFGGNLSDPKLQGLELVASAQQDGCISHRTPAHTLERVGYLHLVRGHVDTVFSRFILRQVFPPRWKSQGRGHGIPKLQLTHLPLYISRRAGLCRHLRRVVCCRRRGCVTALHLQLKVQVLFPLVQECCPKPVHFRTRCMLVIAHSAGICRDTACAFSLCIFVPGVDCWVIALPMGVCPTTHLGISTFADGSQTTFVHEVRTTQRPIWFATSVGVLWYRNRGIVLPLHFQPPALVVTDRAIDGIRAGHGRYFLRTVRDRCAGICRPLCWLRLGSTGVDFGRLRVAILFQPGQEWGPFNDGCLIVNVLEHVGHPL